MRFSKTTSDRLGHYVYGLIDPRTFSIFYIGKASSNNRAYDHLLAKNGEGKKHERILEIRAAKMEPVVEILRSGLQTAKECLEVEAALIDTIGLENLTNSVRGHGIERGRLSAAEFQRRHGSKPVEIEALKDPLMLIFINRTYSPTLNEQELYDCTRQFWSGVSRKNRTPDEEGTLPYPVVLGVVDSVVVRAYSVAAWFPAGTTYSAREYRPSESLRARWEFVGNRIENHPLVGKRLLKGGKAYPANEIGFGYVN